jgi:hypothetical protein
MQYFTFKNSFPNSPKPKNIKNNLTIYKQDEIKQKHLSTLPSNSYYSSPYCVIKYDICSPAPENFPEKKSHVGTLFHVKLHPLGHCTVAIFYQN